MRLNLSRCTSKFYVGLSRPAHSEKQLLEGKGSTLLSFTKNVILTWH